MLNVKQTQVTDHNRSDFYKEMYPMQLDDITGLIDISKAPDPIIAVDCCGWHYQEIYKKNIIMLETIKTAHQFKLSREKFTKLIDNRSDDVIVWPKIECGVNTILMDRSPLLRYKTIPDLNYLLDQMGSTYKPQKMIIKGSLLAIDDYRLRDRFYNWIDFSVSGYIISKFLYDPEKAIWQINLKVQQ
jgi:hypothetical protein